jgi:hypothetical protein
MQIKDIHKRRFQRENHAKKGVFSWYPEACKIHFFTDHLLEAHFLIE